MHVGFIRPRKLSIADGYKITFFFERDQKIGKPFIIPKLFYLTWFYKGFFFKLNLVNLQHFPFPVVAFFHIQNSSNCCRHNNDRSISRVFDFIYFFLFPGLWLSQNWPNKCLTPKTWWPLAIPVTVGTWLWPPFSEAACPWRRLTNKCWTSKTRTGKFSIKICYNLFLVKSQRVQSTLCILTKKTELK